MSGDTRERGAVVALLRADAPSRRHGLANEILERGGEDALIRRLAPPGAVLAGTDVVAQAPRDAARFVASLERPGIQPLTCTSTNYPERLCGVAHPLPP